MEERDEKERRKEKERTTIEIRERRKKRKEKKRVERKKGRGESGEREARKGIVVMEERKRWENWIWLNQRENQTYVNWYVYRLKVEKAVVSEKWVKFKKTW